jgi:hypothetical protein
MRTTEGCGGDAALATVVVIALLLLPLADEEEEEEELQLLTSLLATHASVRWLALCRRPFCKVVFKAAAARCGSLI